MEADYKLKEYDGIPVFVRIFIQNFRNSFGDISANTYESESESVSILIKP